jgi:hypothetical protein
MLFCANAMDPSRRIEDAVVTERTSSPEAQPLNALTRQPFPSIPVSAGVCRRAFRLGCCSVCFPARSIVSS